MKLTGQGFFAVWAGLALVSIAAPARASGPGCVSACVECTKLYASDFEGRLWSINPVTGATVFIGFDSTRMKDIGISADGYLFGISDPSGPIWRISACDASDCLDGTVTGVHNSLGGDLGTTQLYIAGPPLARVISGVPYTYTSIGGTVGSGAGQWCGDPSGDLAVDPTATSNIYVTLSGCTLACPTGADMLAKLNPTTGSATNVGCLNSGGPIAGVLGLAFDSSGQLYGLRNPTGGQLLRIDKLTASVTSIALSGGPVSATGLASLRCPAACTPDLGLPTLNCGVIAGACGSPPYSGASSIVTDCGAKLCLYANASDNCGVLSLTTLQLPTSSASSPTGAAITAKYTESFSTPGVYNVSWKASDSHGNVVTCSASADVRCDQCTVLPANATNWWPLDETSLGTADDRAGATSDDGNHVGSPTFASGKVAGALCFDASSDLVGVPTSAELNFPGAAAYGAAQDFTIDLWAKTSKRLGRQVLLDKRKKDQLTGDVVGYMLLLNNGYFGVQLADGSISEWVAPTFPVDDALWHFLTVTVERYSPSGGKLWVDGTLVLTFDPTPRLGELSTFSILSMAHEQPGFLPTHTFVGCLDEIEFFARALSAPEVQALHRAGAEGKCKCGVGDLTKPCPIGQQEYDNDADGCMEACICDAAFRGECSSCSGTSGSCNPFGLDCPGNAILADGNCDCIYDGCAACPAGTFPKDTDGDGCEDICDCYKLIVLHISPTGIFWPAITGLSSVDIVIGSLSTLKSTGGDFSQATASCLANNAQGTFYPYTQNPPPGNGVWFLARPNTSAGFGSYDSTATSNEGRDPGIAASGQDCAP
jgi:hypothetical protein